MLARVSTPDGMYDVATIRGPSAVSRVMLMLSCEVLYQMCDVSGSRGALWGQGPSVGLDNGGVY